MSRGNVNKLEDGVERKCLVSQMSSPKEGLIRFVTSPDGIVVPDILEKLPGRGYYITADRKVLEEAVKLKVFNRGAKAQVSIPTDLIKEIDEEIAIMQTELISNRSYQKLQNQFENNYVNSNSSLEGVANSLARYHVLYGDTNLINSEIDIYRSITREEIQAVAKKYLNPNQRLILEYLPKII